jgi:hypothetical protein
VKLDELIKQTIKATKEGIDLVNESDSALAASYPKEIEFDLRVVTTVEGIQVVSDPRDATSECSRIKLTVGLVKYIYGKKGYLGY